MKNKGFTLVELLAVIVILAVISIIAIPMIGNVIEESKKKALEQSVNGLVESANYYSIENDGIYEFLFDGEHQGQTTTGQKLSYNGSIDAEGKLYLDKDGNVSICVYNDKYYAYKNYNSGIVIGNRSEDNCDIGYDVISNKYIAFLESEGMSSNVYSKDEVNNLIDSVENKVTNNTNEITDIKESINTIATFVNNNTNTTTTNTSEISSIKENINTLTATVDNNTNIITTNTNEISNIKGTIETLQNSLNKYALQSSLNTTNSNLENLSSIVASNTSSITDINSNLIKYEIAMTNVTIPATSTSVFNVDVFNGIGYTLACIVNTPYDLIQLSGHMDGTNTFMRVTVSNLHTEEQNILVSAIRLYVV